MQTPFKNIQRLIKEKKIEVKYQKGYRAWKKKFDSFYKETNSVRQTLDKIQGGTNNANNDSMRNRRNTSRKNPTRS